MSASLTRRYVKPLFEVACEKNELERIAGDISALDQALKGSPELRRFLADPSIQRRAKRTLIEKVFAEASPYTLNFMRVIINKNRPEILNLTHQYFTELMNIHRGVSPGILETAVPLDDEAFNQVRTTLEKRFGTRLDLERRINPGLLGGLRVRIGNNVIDGSVKGRLAKLRTNLAGA
ncbi:MAG TPA: ATP synthase F1 subunit delta [Bacteroidetes bacterium]|nr:ATP synthase F1 subunit delta [Bacteroidota bacterium]